MSIANKWYFSSGLIGSILILQNQLSEKDLQGDTGLKLGIGLGKGKIGNNDLFKNVDPSEIEHSRERAIHTDEY